MQKKQDEQVLFWHGLTDEQIRESEKKALDNNEGVMDFLRPLIQKKLERERQAEAEKKAKKGKRSASRSG